MASRTAPRKAKKEDFTVEAYRKYMAGEMLRMGLAEYAKAEATLKRAQRILLFALETGRMSNTQSTKIRHILGLREVKFLDWISEDASQREKGKRRRRGQEGS